MSFRDEVCGKTGKVRVEQEGGFIAYVRGTKQIGRVPRGVSTQWIELGIQSDDGDDDVSPGENYERCTSALHMLHPSHGSQWVHVRDMAKREGGRSRSVCKACYASQQRLRELKRNAPDKVSGA
jgi:hypothetical protein